MIKDFISIDLETTGLLPKEDRIIEIGAVKYRDGKETDRFYSLVNPQREIPERITELTGISDRDVKEKPVFREICQSLLDFLGNDVLMAHHISTDYAFLKRGVISLGGAGIKSFEKNGIDTLRIARQCVEGTESRSLSSLCRHYQIPLKAHRALEDAGATAKLYIKMAQEYEKGRERLLQPYQLVYKIKKEGPVTKVQKEQLYRLLKKHGITPEYNVEGLTKNEASRYLDRILSEYGR